MIYKCWIVHEDGSEKSANYDAENYVNAAYMFARIQNVPVNSFIYVSYYGDIRKPKTFKIADYVIKEDKGAT